MDEARIRKIAREEAEQAMEANYSSGTPVIPPHRHNGVDNLAISQKDIIPTPVYTGSITFARNAVYQIDVAYSNVTSIQFNGIAINSAGANQTTVTFRSSLSAGDTNGVLTSTWGGATGYLLLTFSSGEDRSALFTSGSLTVAWPQPLSQPANNSATYGTGTKRALIIGGAQIKPGYFLQPFNVGEVAPGGPKQGIMQQSSCLYTDTGTLNKIRTNVSQEHIVQVYDDVGTLVAQATVAVPYNFNNNTTTSPGKVPIQITIVVSTSWKIVGNFVIN